MKGDHWEPHVPRLGLSVYFKEDGQAENQRLGCLELRGEDGDGRRRLKAPRIQYGRPQGARTPPPGPCLSALRLPGAEVGGLRQRLRTYRMRRSSRPP